jgi:hypothetical protein
MAPVRSDMTWPRAAAHLGVVPGLARCGMLSRSP